MRLHCSSKDALAWAGICRCSAAQGKLSKGNAMRCFHLRRRRRVQPRPERVVGIVGEQRGGVVRSRRVVGQRHGGVLGDRPKEHRPQPGVDLPRPEQPLRPVGELDPIDDRAERRLRQKRSSSKTTIDAAAFRSGTTSRGLGTMWAVSATWIVVLLVASACAGSSVRQAICCSARRRRSSCSSCSASAPPVNSPLCSCRRSSCSSCSASAPPANSPLCSCRRRRVST